MSRNDWPVELNVFGCWVWQKHRDRRDGRALTWRGNKPYAAYREVYEREVGPVPDGLVLDHACKDAACVAPHHLEPVTKSENERRKRFGYLAKQYHSGRRTKCPQGHDIRLNLVVTPRGGRVCRQCNRDSEAAQHGANESPWTG